MTPTVQPVIVQTGSEGEDGLLVFGNGRLVAVLVRLSEQHEDESGRWFLEHGFGRLDGPRHPTFDTVDDAQAWIQTRLARTASRLTG